MIFAGLPRQHFAVIMADPPWTFATRSAKGKGRSPERHYDCMSLDDIAGLPVASLAAPDCALLLWITDPLLPAGLDIIRSWGFAYKTVGFYWTKRTITGKPAIGTGYYTRANPEQCLLATRGAPKRLSKGVRKWIDAPRREHSRKPDEAYERAQQLFAGPHLELFGRESRPGWTTWGNEATKFDRRAA